MTLRAYRPMDQNDQQGNEMNYNNEWQDTLLDRRPAAPRASQGAPRSRVWLLTGLFALAAVLVTGYFVVKGRSDGNSIPLIAADSSAYKVRPDSPGGAEIPFQDKLVFNRLDPNGQPVQAEKLLPPPEEPMANKPSPAPVAAGKTSDDTVATTAAPATTTVTTVTTPSTVAPAPIAAPAMPVAREPAAPVAAPTTTVAVAPIYSVPAGTGHSVSAGTAVTTTATNPKTGTVTTTTAVAPPPVTATKTVAVAPTPKAVAVTAARPTTAPTSGATGSARLQLASIPDEANAQKALASLTGKYGSALGGARLSLTKADIPGKGTYWRVQSQPIGRDAAESACAAIKGQGGTCILAH